MNLAMLALALAAQDPRGGPPTAAGYDPMLDSEIWGFGGIGGPQPGSPQLQPRPIVPDHWAIVPRADGVSAATVLAHWMIDPLADAPIAVDDPARVDVASGRWLARASADPGESLCAFTLVHSDVAEVRMARLTGGAWMLVNGEPFIGDPERRGFRGVPVALRAGENRIFVPANGARFELELWKPPTRLVIEAFDIGWPGGEFVTYPVFDASLEAARSVHVHYGPARPWSGGCKPQLTDWSDGRCCAPLTLVLGVSFYFEALQSECVVTPSARDVYVPICVWNTDQSGQEEMPDRRLLRRKLDAGTPASNNFETVARRPERLAGTLASLVPAQRTHIYAGQSGATYVYATRGSLAETSASLAAARFMQQVCWYGTGQVGPVVSDVEYIATIDSGANTWFAKWTQKHPVVLHGNADTNAAWSRCVPESSKLDAHRGRVQIGTREFEGTDLAGWSSLDGKGADTLVLFDTGEAGTRLVTNLAVAWSGPEQATALFRTDAHSRTAWQRVETANPH